MAQKKATWDRESILAKVKTVIAEQLGVEEDEVVEEAIPLEDLGADSLDIVELVMAYEEEFDLEISDEDAEKWHNVGDVVKYVAERLSPTG